MNIYVTLMLCWSVVCVVYGILQIRRVLDMSKARSAKREWRLNAEVSHMLKGRKYDHIRTAQLR